jgi:hypothetical protein
LIGNRRFFSQCAVEHSVLDMTTYCTVDWLPAADRGRPSRLRLGLSNPGLGP